LEQARALLDTAVGQERAELFPDPSDEARLRESDLDGLPADTAQAIRQLADYDWRSPAARQTFDRLKDLLRSEVLDSQFRGMRQAMSNPDPEAMQRVKDMLGDLNEMLAADARGEHTQADFDRFMERHGELFPDQPHNLEELVDSLISRMAAAADLALPVTDPAQQVIQAAPPGLAPSEQVPERVGRVGAGQDLLAHLIDGAAHVVGQGKRVRAVGVPAVPEVRHGQVRYTFVPLALSLDSRRIR
jgi:hypothetical protein